MVDFHRLITEWYRLNKRNLPWRETKNPYFIWLSEIILQQTRVAQGLSYYLKFVDHYPTVSDLANASELAVLNDWQGLGYYSRARNLHASAKYISEELNSVFPDEHKCIMNLKGVGDYTAAAIASFSFDLPHAVVDGNVYRVLSRVFDVDLPIDSTEGKKYFAQLAQELLPVNSAAIHNQAIMEFGALHCLPANPLCDSCPLTNICLALSVGSISDRPIKSKKIKVRNRFFHYLVFKENGNILLSKRENKDIWQHLYEFPLIETDEERSFSEMMLIFEDKFQLQPVWCSEFSTHKLSHQKIIARFYFFDKIPETIIGSYDVAQSIDIQDYPLPRLIDRFLEKFEL